MADFFLSVVILVGGALFIIIPLLQDEQKRKAKEEEAAKILEKRLEKRRKLLQRIEQEEKRFEKMMKNDEEIEVKGHKFRFGTNKLMINGEEFSLFFIKDISFVHKIDSIKKLTKYGDGSYNIDILTTEEFIKEKNYYSKHYSSSDPNRSYTFYTQTYLCITTIQNKKILFDEKFERDIPINSFFFGVYDYIQDGEYCTHDIEKLYYSYDELTSFFQLYSDINMRCLPNTQKKNAFIKMYTIDAMKNVYTISTYDIDIAQPSKFINYCISKINSYIKEKSFIKIDSSINEKASNG